MDSGDAGGVSGLKKKHRKPHIDYYLKIQPHIDYYLKQLIDFAENHHCACHGKLLPIYKKREFEFSIYVIGNDTKWRIDGGGTNKRRRIAIALGLQSILIPLRNRFKEKTTEWHFLSSMLRETKIRLPKKLRSREKRSHTSHQPSGDSHASHKSSSKKISMRMKKTQILPPPFKQIVFDSLAHTLYICKSAKNCRQKNHVVYAVTGILASVRGTPIKIIVKYCANCRMYFIGYQEYQNYIDFYGPMLGKIAVFKEAATDSDAQGFRALAKESILKICGYTVLQGEMKEQERRCILANIMDRKSAQNSYVMEHLQFFINSHHNQAAMVHAVSKWRDDLDWVRNYHIDTQRRFIIAGVRHT